MATLWHLAKSRSLQPHPVVLCSIDSSDLHLHGLHACLPCLQLAQKQKQGEGKGMDTVQSVGSQGTAGSGCIWLRLSSATPVKRGTWKHKTQIGGGAQATAGTRRQLLLLQSPLPPPPRGPVPSSQQRVLLRAPPCSLSPALPWWWLAAEEPRAWLTLSAAEFWWPSLQLAEPGLSSYCQIQTHQVQSQQSPLALSTVGAPWWSRQGSLGHLLELTPQAFGRAAGAPCWWGWKSKRHRSRGLHQLELTPQAFCLAAGAPCWLCW